MGLGGTPVNEGATDSGGLDVVVRGDASFWKSHLTQRPTVASRSHPRGRITAERCSPLSKSRPLSKAKAMMGGTACATQEGGAWRREGGEGRRGADVVLG